MNEVRGPKYAPNYRLSARPIKLPLPRFPFWLRPPVTYEIAVGNLESTWRYFVQEEVCEDLSPRHPLSRRARVRRRRPQSTKFKQPSGPQIPAWVSIVQR